MNFSFWPFLWFGLPGRLLTKSARFPCETPICHIVPISRIYGRRGLQRPRPATGVSRDTSGPKTPVAGRGGCKERGHTQFLPGVFFFRASSALYNSLPQGRQCDAMWPLPWPPAQFPNGSSKGNHNNESKN